MVVVGPDPDTEESEDGDEEDEDGDVGGSEHRASAGQTDGFLPKANKTACWMYPGEHMSFSLLQMMGPLGSPRGGDLAEAVKAEPDETLEFGGEVGSALHLIGISNFFHLIREGMGSMLYLSQVLPPDVPILVPASAAFRALLALIPAPGNGQGSGTLSLDPARLVFVPESIGAVRAGRVWVADWRPPASDSSPAGQPTDLSRIFNMDFVGEQSASVLMNVRRAINGGGPDFMTGATAATATAAAGEGGIGPSKVRAEVTADGSVRPGGRAVHLGPAAALATPYPPPPPPQGAPGALKKVVYVSRADASVRRVPEERELIAAIARRLNERPPDEEDEEEDEEGGAEGGGGGGGAMGGGYEVEALTLTGVPLEEVWSASRQTRSPPLSHPSG